LSSVPNTLFSIFSTLPAKLLIEIFIWILSCSFRIYSFSGFLCLYWVPLSYSAWS
jgi:hypothetical protein